ncbi:metallophosphoesterase family protein [Roseivirga sp.]|uniref:metallophosphoesterase family protein n=1 Tax=Roseivirga sp. TaxID=1964215 RepID=UPI003B525727
MDLSIFSRHNMVKPILGVIIVCFTACEGSNDKHTDLNHYTLQLDQSISAQLDELVPLDVDATQLSNLWQVDLSDTQSGVDVAMPDFPGEEQVTLPHRINLPDHSIWYKAVVSLDKGVLQVNADDGAQVWVNGQRIRPALANFYPVDQSGQHELTIRVINNAMAGGLRSVSFIPQSAWQDHINHRELRAAVRLLLEKSFLLELSNEERKSIAEAIHSLNRQMIEQTLESLADRPVLLAEPILQKSTDDQYYLRWVSSSNSPATLYWGENADDLHQQREVEGKEGVFLVPVQQAGLSCRIEQLNTVSPIYDFSESVANSRNRFMVWADSQSGWPVFDSIMQMSNEYGFRFSVGAGDLVNQGDDDLEYLRFLRSLHQSSITHYPVPGNHDYDGYYEDLRADNYQRYLGLPAQENYFAWREGELAFVALDFNESFPVGLPTDASQFEWFREQLNSEAWKTARWRFLVMHHPPYSQGWPGYHGELSIRELLEPLYESAGIDMIIAGHTHDYERLIKDYGQQQTAFVIVGGAGGGLEPEENSPYPEMDVVMSQHHFGIIETSGDTLRFSAVGLEGEVLDEFRMVKPKDRLNRLNQE